METPSDKTLDFPARLKQAWLTARKCLLNAQERQKTQYDKRANTSSDKFSVNDRVYVYNPAVKKGTCPKFAKHYHGPQRILSLDGTNAMVIMESSPRAKAQKVHLNRLKLAQDQSGPSGLRQEVEQTDAEMNDAQ